MEQRLLIELSKIYLSSLRTPPQEPCGVLNIEVDDVEVFKADYIRPMLPGYDTYQKVCDQIATQQEETDIILPFEELTVQAYSIVEQEFIRHLATLLGC